MFAQQVINGLMLGGVYVLVAVAFTLTIGVLNFMNFSIPGLFMLGGMVAWKMLALGLPWQAALLVALAVAAVASLAVERFTYRFMKGADPEVPLVSSLGFLVLFENLGVIAFGSDQQAFPAIAPDLTLRIGDLVMGAAQLISLGCAVAVVMWLAWFLRATVHGRRIRAIAEDPRTATVLGIEVDRIVPMIFLFSGVFTALGGVLFAVNYLQVSPFMGEGVGFKGIAAMIIGGMGNIWGAVLGGLLIGLTEVLSIHLLGASTVNITVYGLLLVILLVRPEGLLGGASKREKL